MSGLDLFEKENNERLSKLRLTDTIDPTPWANDYLFLAGCALVIAVTIIFVIFGVSRYRQHRRKKQKPPLQDNPPIQKYSEGISTTSSNCAGSPTEGSEKISTNKAIIWFIGFFIFSGLLGITAASIFGVAVGSNVAIGTMLGGIAWIFSTKEGKALKEKDLNPFRKKNE